MKRAAIYGRVSYIDREGENLESQLEMGRAYCKERGYVVAAELTEDDKGASGASLDLPALNQALELAQSGQVDVLVVRELDRLSRSLAKQFIVEDHLKAAGVELEFCLYDYPDTAEGRLNRHIRAILAEYERAKATERTLRGRIESAKRGNVLVAVPPYGYDLEAHQENGKRATYRLRIREDEAATVRLIFELYTFGDIDTDTPALGTGRVARELTQRGIPTRADTDGMHTKKTTAFAQWSPGFVRQVVMNPAYKGEWTYNTESAGDIIVPVEPIVDPALFDRAQRKRKSSRTTWKGRTRHPYLLQARAYCGRCGYKMECHTHTYQAKKWGRDRYMYYRCPTTHDVRVRKCDSAVFSYRADAVDAAVWQVITDYIENPARMLEAHQLKAQTRERPDDQRLDRIDKQLAELRRKTNLLYDLHVEGQFTGAILSQRLARMEVDVERLTLERETLVEQLALTAARQDQLHSFALFAQRVRYKVQVASFERRRLIVEALNVTARLDERDGQRFVSVDLDGIPLPSRDI